MGAGVFRFPALHWSRVRFERAWWCPLHRTYWYDDGGSCRVCGRRGEPEPLPAGAVVVDEEE